MSSTRTQHHNESCFLHDSCYPKLVQIFQYSDLWSISEWNSHTQTWKDIQFHTQKSQAWIHYMYQYSEPAIMSPMIRHFGRIAYETGSCEPWKQLLTQSAPQCTCKHIRNDEKLKYQPLLIKREKLFAAIIKLAPQVWKQCSSEMLPSCSNTSNTSTPTPTSDQLTTWFNSSKPVAQIINQGSIHNSLQQRLPLHLSLWKEWYKLDPECSFNFWMAILNGCKHYPQQLNIPYGLYTYSKQLWQELLLTMEQMDISTWSDSDIMVRMKSTSDTSAFVDVRPQHQISECRNSSPSIQSIASFVLIGISFTLKQETAIWEFIQAVRRELSLFSPIISCHVDNKDKTLNQSQSMSVVSILIQILEALPISLIPMQFWMTLRFLLQYYDTNNGNTSLNRRIAQCLNNIVSSVPISFISSDLQLELLYHWSSETWTQYCISHETTHQNNEILQKWCQIWQHIYKRFHAQLEGVSRFTISLEISKSILSCASRLSASTNPNKIMADSSSTGTTAIDDIKNHTNSQSLLSTEYCVLIIEEWDQSFQEWKCYKQQVTDQLTPIFLQLTSTLLDLLRICPSCFIKPGLSSRIARKLQQQLCHYFDGKQHVASKETIKKLVQLVLQITEQLFLESDTVFERNIGDNNVWDQYPDIWKIMEQYGHNWQVLPQPIQHLHTAYQQQKQWEETMFELENKQIEIPDEFLDPITAEWIHEPIRLPHGVVMDKEVLARSLQDNQGTDPFTKLPLKLDDCVAEETLKIKMHQWLTDHTQSCVAKQEQEQEPQQQQLNNNTDNDKCSFALSADANPTLKRKHHSCSLSSDSNKKTKANDYL